MAERKRPPKTSATNGGVETATYVLVLYQDYTYTPSEYATMTADPLVTNLCKAIDAIPTPREHVEIDVWLESPGGDAHAAYKLGVLLRAHARRIRAVVPDYAKSAATLLAIAADEIYMAPAAELGPLDAQIPREGGLVSTISALDIARSLDDLAQTALDIALERGAQVLNVTRLTRAESLSTMLDWSAKFMEPIVRQIDPTMIHWSSTLLRVSASYAARLLEMREVGMTADVGRLPGQLVENYPTHGFVISRDEAREQLGLPVRRLSEYAQVKEAKALHDRFRATKTNVVTLQPLAEFGLDGGSDAGAD